MGLDFQWLETGHAILTIETDDDDAEESVTVTLEFDEARLLEMLDLLNAAKAKMDADAERAAVVGAELLGVKR